MENKSVTIFIVRLVSHNCDYIFEEIWQQEREPEKDLNRKKQKGVERFDT